MQDASRDSLWGGRLTLWQPARGHGYRFNLDPVLLAGFAPAASHVLDLGAGCGVLGLLLAAGGKAERVTAIEIQPALAELARKNATDNGLLGRFDVLARDLRRAPLPSAAAVVFNPPYIAHGTGRPPPEAGRGAARHEVHGTLADFVQAGAGALADGGPLCVILPTARRTELEQLLAARGLRIVRARSVQARYDVEPQLVMVEARAEGDRREEAPLVVHEGEGFSEEVRALLAGPI